MMTNYGTATKSKPKPPTRPYHDVPMTERQRQALDLVIDHNGSTVRELVRQSNHSMPSHTMHESLRFLVEGTMVEEGKRRRCSIRRQQNVKTWWLVPWGNWPTTTKG